MGTKEAQEEEEEAQPVQSFCLEQLDNNPYASRLDLTALEDLVSSMKTHGQLSPIKIRRSSKDNSRFEVVFGHRRVTAARALEWKKITAQLVEATDEEMVQLALAENIDRMDFTDYEIGLSLQKMKDQFNKSLEEIAVLIGKSVSYVSEHIKLTHLFDSVNESPAEISSVLQKVSVRQARILIREPNALTRFRLARFCLAERIGEQEMNRLVGHPRPESFAKGDKLLCKNSKKEEFAIRQLLEECIRGLNNWDVRPQFRMRDPKTFSMFDDFPPFGLLDFENAAQHLCGYYRRFEEFHLDYDSLQVKVVGNAAYAAFFVTYRVRIDGKGAVGRSRATFVFSKVDGKWQSIHEHWSPSHSEFVTERLLNPQIQIL